MIPELSDETRKAVSAAFEAMSTWRSEIVNNSEKNVEQVIDKMGAAALALGWPEQIIDTTRTQLQSITRMQVETMDRMMDVWEEQIKSPNPSAIMSKLTFLPNFGPAGSWSNSDRAGNPFQLYMQLAQQWQKAWADAVALWSQSGPRRQ